MSPPFTHHAYLVSADRTSGLSYIRDILAREWGFETMGNPDLRIWDAESFSVDEARDARDVAARKSFGERQVCIIAADTFTVEAQNALLKVLEDPGEGTHFFVITPNAGILLPTLLSRLARLEIEQTEVRTGIAEEFLAMDVPARLAYLESMIKNKDKNEAATLLDSVIVVLRARATKSGADAFAASAPLLRELSDMRGYLTDRSSSVKLIMEHVSFILPTRNV
ncbi:MAG: hypothetical protein HGA67_03645 [Candidatus Yonathbacteria bacterium]|nr:hypothetical protein [Candidatus Yonathbacteria bacterium]